MPKRPIEIHGYAIVSDDDKIADAEGQIPAALRNDKDWQQYQAALASSDLVVFARVSHENEPETHGVPRIVVSREAKALEQRGGDLVVEPGGYRLAGSRCARAARGRRSGRARWAGRLRSVPEDRLRRLPPRAREGCQACPADARYSRNVGTAFTPRPCSRNTGYGMPSASNSIPSSMLR